MITALTDSALRSEMWSSRLTSRDVKLEPPLFIKVLWLMPPYPISTFKFLPGYARPNTTGKNIRFRGVWTLYDGKESIFSHLCLL